MPKPGSTQKSSEEYPLQPYRGSTHSLHSASLSEIQIHSPTTSRLDLTSPFNPNASTARLLPHPSSRNNSTLNLHPHSIRSSKASLLRPDTANSAATKYESPYTTTGSSAKFLSPHNAGTSSRPSSSHSTPRLAARTVSVLSTPPSRPTSAISSIKSQFDPSKSPPSPRLTIIIPDEHPKWHRSGNPNALRFSRRGGLLDMNERVRAIAVTMTLALMVLIGIPMGAILPQKYVVPLPVNILMPLYINPELGGWDMLYTSTIKTSDSNFTVIVNPSHGPGNTTWPSGLYIKSIQRLSKAPNVRVIGYIDTQNGTRPNTTIFDEIKTYAGWNKSGIAISGIFFDNTPARDWKFGDAGRNFTAREYMTNVTDKVRRTGGFLEPKLVVHNPGNVPSVNLTTAATGANVTVMYEGPYEVMPWRAELKAELEPLGGKRENYAYMVHDVPTDIKRADVRKIVDGTRRSVEYLYVTTKGGDNKYEDYSDAWEKLLEVVW